MELPITLWELYRGFGTGWIPESTLLPTLKGSVTIAATVYAVCNQKGDEPK